jgi:tryptophan-rich sensory protein
MAISSKWINVLKLLVSICACLCAGLVGSFFTRTAVSIWYAALERPVFAPPNWVFGPVWTVLYIMMGIAAFLVWKKGWEHREVKLGLITFLVQLILNAMWSIVFFGFESPISGVVVILGLLVVILFTIIRFFRVSKVAGWLLVPYILWVSFAALLNISIWLLNPQA